MLVSSRLCLVGVLPSAVTGSALLRSAVNPRSAMSLLQKLLYFKQADRGSGAVEIQLDF